MKIQNKLLEGRPHLVVPVVMGVAGVWAGSEGPLLYTEQELKRSVPHWNGRPAVVYHPSMSSNFCAGAPEVFSRQRVGTIFNARFDARSNALKAEVWLDPERLAKVDTRVLEAVRRGEVMEVSTGLFTVKEEVQGVFDGREFVAIATDHRPDHLAILPDEIGACSVEMGAGLCRNELTEWTKFKESLPEPLPLPMLFA